VSGGNKTTGKTPNYVLQEERLQHRWTQQDVADKIGTTAVNVSRWERGATSPSPYFRQQLCRLFEKDAAALGLLPAIPSSNNDVCPSQEESASPTSEKELAASPDHPTDEEVASPVVEKELAASPDHPTDEEIASPLIVEKKSAKSSNRLFSLFSQRRLPSWLSAAFIGVLVIGLVLVVNRDFLSSSLFVHQASGTVRPLSQEKPVCPTSSLPKLMYSFEDGATDGWAHKGHIMGFQNSSEVGGYEGSHALRVAFSSRSSTDLPFISVNPPCNQPKSGQILRAAVFVPGGTSATVSAKLYVQDSTYRWQMPDVLTPLVPGKWQVLQYPLPAFPGPALQVGMQFLSVPFNTQTTVYVDAVAW
jgi:transcriptional regulator with XRE-family HTH domain